MDHDAERPAESKPAKWAGLQELQLRARSVSA
jgi:hypothetical protein